MASYNVNNGDIITIDETLSDTIDYININDGVCNITNNSDKGLILAFESAGYISVKSFGQLNVRGSMLELGKSDGSRGFSVNNWQSEHDINIVFVETDSGTDKYEPWYSINSNGSTILTFSDFPDNYISGRVFELNDGKISFSPNDGEAAVPKKDCKIKVPNIVFSTVKPFSSTIAAKINYNEGGLVSMKDVSFSDFNEMFMGIGSLNLERVFLYGSAFIEYCNDFMLNDVHAGIQGNYSTGLNFSYSANGKLKNISGVSSKSAGVSFNYLKEMDVDGVVGVVAKRDSSNDSSISLSTVQKSTMKNIVGIGGRVRLNNTSRSRISNITTIDSTLFSENSNRPTSNLYIEDSSETTVRSWNVPKNGGSKSAYLTIKNSPNIDIVKSKIDSSSAINVVSCDVSFDTRISEMYYEGYTGKTPFLIPAKNNGVLLQHITSPKDDEISIQSPGAIIKGANALSIKTDNAGAYGSNFAQLYTSDTEGKLIFIMAKDLHKSNFFDNILGSVKFSNNGRSYFGSNGDSVEVVTPYRIKGVTFKDIGPKVNGYNTKVLSSDYAIDLGEGYSAYKTLNAENLSSEKIDPNIGFMMKIRTVSSNMDGTTYMSSIELDTIDKRHVYPLDFEVGKIVFDQTAMLDTNAKYFVYYTKGYGTPEAVMVKNADGLPINGKVDGKDHIDFTYDFIGDVSNGRIADKPFSITIVFAGSDMAQNVMIEQEFNKGQVNVFTMRPEKEYAYLGV